MTKGHAWGPETQAVERMARQSLLSLRTVLQDLREAQDAVLAGQALRRVVAEAEGLSAGLSRLYRRLEALPRAAPPTSAPPLSETGIDFETVKAWLAQVQDLRSGQSIICSCGGLRPAG